MKLMRMLTDRGTEYCGNGENHEYELYLAVEDIDHSKIKGEKPSRQTVYVSDLTEPCRMSSMLMHSERKSIPLSNNASRPLCVDELLQYPKNTLRKVLFFGRNAHAETFIRRNRWAKKVSTAKSGNE